MSATELDGLRQRIERLERMLGLSGHTPAPGAFLGFASTCQDPPAASPEMIERLRAAAKHNR